MQTTTKMLSLVVVVLLLGLTVAAAISLHTIQTLSLPISKAAAVCTIILPLLTGLSLQGSQSLNLHPQPQNQNNPRNNNLALLIFTLFTIYETALATFSLTHIAPVASLTCRLDQQWQRFWSTKDAGAIRAIQDRYHCCGLHSVVNMPWPFPTKERPVSACRDALGSGASCLGFWRRDLQVAAGLLLGVAVGCFVLKVTVYLYVRGRASGSGWRVRLQGSRNGKDGRRAIEGNDGDGTPYRDDPEAEDGDQECEPRTRKAIAAAASPDTNGTTQQQHGPVVQPSRLHEGQGDQNAWV